MLPCMSMKNTGPMQWSLIWSYLPKIQITRAKFFPYCPETGEIASTLQLATAIHVANWKGSFAFLGLALHPRLHTCIVPMHQWLSLCGTMHGPAHAIVGEAIGVETDCHLLGGGRGTWLLQTWKWQRTKSLLPVCMKQQQPPCAVVARSVHARLHPLINFPGCAEPLLMKQLILRAGGMFHNLVHSVDSRIP